jgi:hypothetical protein
MHAADSAGPLDPDLARWPEPEFSPMTGVDALELGRTVTDFSR